MRLSLHAIFVFSATLMAAASLSCGRLMVWISAAVVLQIVGLSLFLIGFFPVKPTLPGLSGPESYQMPSCEDVVEAEFVDRLPHELAAMYRDLSKIPPAFDRMILMVIDGLPAEFVLGRAGSPPKRSVMEAMPYTQSLLLEKRATAYHAKAAPPTVTMPRLKAVVSGAIGGFLDLAFNFNTQAFFDDNLLDQFYRIGWKMVMFGDDTWMKLFPGLFARQDGVSSFFVKDTIEVDYNVSRHLEVELAADDWKLMILHYLGLDHVGHIGGRQSFLMVPKLEEMDEIVRLIHTHDALKGDIYGERTLLVVVSDHGMTPSGNHGGSSYEETDSLALFIDLRAPSPGYAPCMHNEVFQVDIAPTLAVLFGVPIPKNNLGVLLIEALNSFTDEQKLRALELNTWQLLRLLKVHLPGLLCGNLKHSITANQVQLENKFFNDIEVRLWHFYSKAGAAHTLWRLHAERSSLISDYGTNLNSSVASYYDFLRTASEWLSHRATDKHITWLLAGVVAMFLSSILLLHLLFLHVKEGHPMQRHLLSPLKKYSYTSLHLDRSFVFFATLLHACSLGSSSMVEEEQYTWHFLTSTLYLILLYMNIRSSLTERTTVSVEVNRGEENLSLQVPQISNFATARYTSYTMLMQNSCINHQICSLLIVLLCGRILRGWHQGGINWAHLPDIAKWLEQAGSPTVKSLQIISLLLVLMLSLFSHNSAKSRGRIILVVSSGVGFLGFLVFLHIMKNQSVDPTHLNHHSTMIAQIFYLITVIILFGALVLIPWISFHPSESTLVVKTCSNFLSSAKETDSLLLGIQESLYLIGGLYASSWCLLQLLLQQAINSVPILLILVQMMASIIYFSFSKLHHGHWLEVAALYFLGIEGHFGLGNSNSLSTIDVAGAFIGISSYSTMFSGMLMFIITFASPILSYLSMVVGISMRSIVSRSISEKPDLGHTLKLLIAPCLLPFVLNSVVLTTFTFILLLMRGHLFVWSVFSPKYLYVCAATVSVYFGLSVVAMTVAYTCYVFFYRAKKLNSRI
ncbi:ethanolaminephosphotransferase [Apostasia shenzhenica]|uniref:Ethanolaminephosphotransferase n=1 Tax=Apostasia shenzhenica TaxID=1088818 RepID=A0A2I0B5Z1_9ASPA|nr:ethanolaminephosphotransferase [Apostasia shenzhenica]